MNAVWLVALAALGVQYSYRTGLDRQPEYVLQIEPEVLPALAAGEQIYSEIPSNVGPFARLCLIILPPDGTPAKHTSAAEEQFRQLLVSSARYATRDRNVLASDLPPAILWPGRGAGTPEAHYGVSTGWHADAMGQQQFIVQLDPVLVGTLSSGDELYIPIDPAAGRLARFVVKVGKENLPRISQPPQVALDAGRSAPADVRNGGNAWSAAGGVGGGFLNPGTSDSGGASRQSSLPGENAGREVAPSSWGWPTAGSSARFSANEPSPGRPVEPAAAVASGGTGEYSSRGFVPPAGVPAGLPASEMWGPPAASVGPPGGYAPVGPPPGYGPASPPAPGDLASRGYGPVSVDPRGSPYPDMRTAGLPSGPTTAGSAGAGSPTRGAPAGQAPGGLPNAAPGSLAAPLPNGTSAGASPAGVAPTAGNATETDRPWGLLLFVTFALFFSIGGNLYLAYTALEYHNRYRSALERLRAAARGN